MNINSNSNNQSKNAFRQTKNNLTGKKSNINLSQHNDKYKKSTPIITDVCDSDDNDNDNDNDDGDGQRINLFPSRQFTERGNADIPQSRVFNTTQCNQPSVPKGDLIDGKLNVDVTEFLRILNDTGSRISYYIDPSNANDFASSRDIITNEQNLDSITSNIIKGVEDIKVFLYEFGKKNAQGRTFLEDRGGTVF